ncbi:MAG: UDP-glucose 4-epimerase GalE [Alphaproteobacteria bacterium]|nr:UDP-glucose 4-epimerase GalE [Alphaproteobacteria bacterium]
MATRGAVLVTGGAGYIGSHVVLALQSAGWPVVVVDNLTTGVRRAVAADVPFAAADAGDTDRMQRLFADHGVVAVMHFAGSVVVPESVADPLKYYRNNTGASRNLIAACVQGGVKHFIFSSTAAVYGIPDRILVGEDSATVPINPYGTSKLMTEWMLRDVAAMGALRYTALRYFNVAGADPAGRVGQSTPNATHLIKVAAQTALGQRPVFAIFGEDYDTPDGTCVRDFIHVTDLATAHVLALDHLIGGGESLVLNCGYGQGFSVRDVLRAIERVSGKTLKVERAPRRAGDPPALVARADRILDRFGWRPAHADLEGIVRSAYAWEQKLAGGA